MTLRCNRRAFLRRSFGALLAAGLAGVFPIAPTPTLRASATAPSGAPAGLCFDWAPRVKIVGVGGAGGNAIRRMLERGIAGASLCVADTNLYPAQYPPQVQTLCLGPRLTHGLGAGGLLERGAAAALDSEADLRALLAGTDLAVIVAGMGGGTGGGAGPVIARLARDAGATVVALVTMPFYFEGSRRKAGAAAGLAGLQAASDSAIAIPCDGLLPTHHKQTLMAAFGALDDLLCRATRSLVEPITVPGLISVDPDTIRLGLCRGGAGCLALGDAMGEDCGRRAAEAALASPFLAGPIASAPAIFFSMRCGVDVALMQVLEAGEAIAHAADPDVILFCGAIVDPALPDDRVEVALFAAGLGQAA